MKLAKLFAESGAAAVHLEDQLHGGKKCGHQSGKVVVPTKDHIDRLVATRLQWDILGSNNILIARTDAESARLLSSTSDPRDHQDLLGASNKACGISLSQHLSDLKSKGATPAQLACDEEEWLETAELMTFEQAAARHIETQKGSATAEKFVERTKGLTIFQARSLAQELCGETLHWDCEAVRTTEGFYRTRGGIDAAVRRAIAYAPYADMLWLETSQPTLVEASDYARQIRNVCPDKMLVYNLSPSFNWTAQGFDDGRLRSFIWDLAKEGFALQLISLAGLHSSGLGMWELAKAYKDDGMLAYVNLVQRPERELGCDVLTHQKWYVA
ncbi:Isocitrate lyase [Saitozyma sp. JCM 24511]|nr:Isocitrate lyase [Saitozyma sp. JCM 24511]